MTITTSKGLTIPVQWAWKLNVMGVETLMIGFTDIRSFSQFVSDFEGCDLIYRNSEEEGDLIFEGFTKLVSINRPDLLGNPDQVEVHLIR